MEAMKKGGKVKQKQKQKQKQQQTVNVYVGRPQTRKQVRKPPPPPFMSFAMQDPGFIRLLNPQQPGQPQALQPQVRHPALFQPGPPQPLFQQSQPTPAPAQPEPISFSVPGQPQQLKKVKNPIDYDEPAQPAPAQPAPISLSQPGIPLSISNASLSTPLQLPEMQNIMKALKDSTVSQGEGYEDDGKEEMPALEPVSMSSASDAGPSRSTSDLARSLYVEPNPLSPEFKIPASVPAVKRKPSGGKMGWTEYYQTVKGGFDRAKAIFGTRDKDDPSVKQFFGMVYKQYEKYLDL